MRARTAWMVGGLTGESLALYGIGAICDEQFPPKPAPLRRDPGPRKGTWWKERKEYAPASSRRKPPR